MPLATRTAITLLILGAPVLAAPDEGLDAWKAMRAFHAGLSEISASANTVVDVEMEPALPGMMAPDQTSRHDLALAWPDRAALRCTEGQGESLVMDGTQVLAVSDAFTRYTLEPVEGGLQGFFAGERSLPIPAAMGLRVIADATYDPRVTLLGEVDLDGVAATHLRLDSSEGMRDLEVWIAREGKPWLLRVQQAPMTQEMAMGDLELEITVTLTASYTDWSTDPVDGTVFVVDPPEGYVRADSLIPEDVMTMGADQGPGPGKRAPKGAGAGGLAQAPDVRLQPLDGEALDLSSLRGKVVVLDFWATWCKPCLMALPVVTEVTASLADRGVIFYAVNVRESEDKVRALLEKRGLSFPVALDRDGAVSSAFGVNPIPHTIVIDQQGRVASSHVGYSDAIGATLRREIEGLLDGE